MVSMTLYKIVNNPIEKMHLSEIQLEKFMRQNMNMNKNFFHTFQRVFASNSMLSKPSRSKLSSESSIRVCIHFTSRVEALNEIYFFVSREVTHFDARIRNSTAFEIKLPTLRYMTINQRNSTYMMEGKESYLIPATSRGPSCTWNRGLGVEHFLACVGSWGEINP